MTGSGTSVFACDMSGGSMQSYALQGVQQVYALAVHAGLIYMHAQTTAAGSGMAVVNASALSERPRMLRSSLVYNTISVLKVYQRNRPTGEFIALYRSLC